MPQAHETCHIKESLQFERQIDLSLPSSTAQH